MKVKVYTYPSSLRALKVKVKQIKTDKEEENKRRCPVCGDIVGKQESCCDESDMAPMRDEDDPRTLEIDYDY